MTRFEPQNDFERAVEKAKQKRVDALLRAIPTDAAMIGRLQGEFMGLVEAVGLFRAATKIDRDDDGEMVRAA